MKPVYLKMQAFGPYAQEQIIDFTRLGTHDFFLITGPTGAGKTTILDAMTFALYGTGSGCLRSGKSLRSDYAPADFPTQVEFTFALGRKHYRVTRSPEQLLQKKRGTGTRTLPAQAALWAVGPDGSLKALAVKVDQVTAAVTSLLGFKADQFTQIVILPQGEFRQFLIADSQARKSILETIFRTGFYSRLENILDQQAQKLQAAYKELKQQQEYYFLQLGCEDIQELPERLTALAAAVQKAEQKMAAQEKLQQEAQNKLTAAQNLAAKFAEAETAEKNLAALQKQEPQWQEKQKFLQQIQAALVLQDPFKRASESRRRQNHIQDEQGQLRKSCSQCQKEEERLQQQLTGVLMALTPAASSAPDPAGAAAQLNDTIAALTEEAGQLAGVNGELERLAASLKEGQPCPVCGSLQHPCPATQTAAAKKKLARVIASKKQTVSQLQKLQVQMQDAHAAVLQKKSQLQILQENWDRQSSEAKTTAASFKAAYQNSIFTNWQDFLQAFSKIGELETRRTALTHWQEQLTSGKSRLKLAQEQILGQAAPDLLPLKNFCTLAQKNYTDSVKEKARLQEKLEQYQKSAKALADLSQQSAQIQKDYETAGALAKAAKGSNSQRLSLSAYVLQTILDDVLQAANLRLDTMTQGRFQLSRSHQLLDARKKSGLDIQVLDANTGVFRPVQTLSGGEIFLASLALALGLTDVVQAYAGGLRLDTILVDEGFGSLDPEALEAALAALIQLQENGRLVGIISHVTELEHCIPYRLEIIPSKNGSQAVWHLPDEVRPK